MTKHQLQMAIYLFALLLSVSVTLPLTSFPVYGEVSYYRIAQLEAWLVIAFSLSAPALILGGKGKWSMLSPLGVWLVLFFPALRSYFESSSSTVLGRLGDDISTAMVDFTADFFLNITEFHWGGLVFLFALMLFTVSNLLYRLKT